MEPYFEYHYVANEKLLEGIKELSDQHYIELPSIPDVIDQSIILPLLRSEVETISKKLGEKPYKLGNNLNEEIDKKIAFEHDKINVHQSEEGKFGFVNSRSGYPTFQGILREIHGLSRSQLVTVENLSTEMAAGYQSLPDVHIPLIKIGNRNSRTLVVVGGAHPDEYLSIVIALEVCYSILRYNNSEIESDFSKQVKDFLQDGSIHVIPVLNPSGYRHNTLKNRKWRKNLQKNRLNFCKLEKLGANLNRNYPIHFGWNAKNTDPDSAEYQGPFPLSENETRSLSLHLQKHNQIKGLIDFHTRDGLVIYRPRFGFTVKEFPQASQTVDENNEAKLAQFEDAFISGANTGQMAVFNSKGQGPNTGALDDYAFFAHNLLAMTVECGKDCSPDLTSPTTKTLIQGAINGVIFSLKTL